MLIHGTVASLHTWEGWAAALRGERRVVSFDLPGFGLTGPNASGDYGMAADTRFVLDLLDTLQIERCVLVGSSLGGEIAWRTALLAPRRVGHLVLVDAGGYAFTTRWVRLGFRVARTLFVRGFARNVLPRGLVEFSLRHVYGDPSRVSEALVDRYYELTLREGNRKALARRFEQLQPGADAAQIATLKVPTLILWGGRDRLFPPEMPWPLRATSPAAAWCCSTDSATCRTRKTLRAASPNCGASSGWRRRCRSRLCLSGRRRAAEPIEPAKHFLRGGLAAARTETGASPRPSSRGRASGARSSRMPTRCGLERLRAADEGQRAAQRVPAQQRARCGAAACCRSAVSISRSKARRWPAALPRPAARCRRRCSRAARRAPSARTPPWRRSARRRRRRRASAGAGAPTRGRARSAARSPWPCRSA